MKRDIIFAKTQKKEYFPKFYISTSNIRFILFIHIRRRVILREEIPFDWLRPWRRRRRRASRSGSPAPSSISRLASSIRAAFSAPSNPKPFGGSRTLLRWRPRPGLPGASAREWMWRSSRFVLGRWGRRPPPRRLGGRATPARQSLILSRTSAPTSNPTSTAWTLAQPSPSWCWLQIRLVFFILWYLISLLIISVDMILMVRCSKENRDFFLLVVGYVVHTRAAHGLVEILSLCGSCIWIVLIKKV